MARRRCRQGGGAQSRRARALGVQRSHRRRLPLFHLLQSQQAQHHVQSQDRRRQGAADAPDREGGRARREHGAGHLRATGLRLSAAQPDQSASDLRPDQGLRAGEPARELLVLRHDRPGDGRHDGGERPSGRPAHPAGRHDRRYRHGHVVCHGNSRRPLSAHGDGPRPAHPDRHARCDAELLPHADEPPGRPRRRAAARRQWRRGDGAGRPLQVRPRRARRLVLHFRLAGQRGALAAARSRDRPRGPAERSAHGRRAHPRQEPGGGRRGHHRMDLATHEAGGDGRSSPGRGFRAEPFSIRTSCCTIRTCMRAA